MLTWSNVEQDGAYQSNRRDFKKLYLEKFQTDRNLAKRE